MSAGESDQLTLTSSISSMVRPLVSSSADSKASSTPATESWKIFSGTPTELQDELNERAWADTIPRFALRPEALDQGRYARFELFLSEAGLIEGVRPVSDLAVDLGTQ